jgi:hypothetical protein
MLGLIPAKQHQGSDPSGMRLVHIGAINQALAKLGTGVLQRGISFRSSFANLRFIATGTRISLDL